jgi:hypothetical protein
MDSLGLAKVIRVLHANNYTGVRALDVVVEMDKVFSVKRQKHSIFSGGIFEDLFIGNGLPGFARIVRCQNIMAQLTERLNGSLGEILVRVETRHQAFSLDRTSSSISA